MLLGLSLQSLVKRGGPALHFSKMLKISQGVAKKHDIFIYNLLLGVLSIIE